MAFTLNLAVVDGGVAVADQLARSKWLQENATLFQPIGPIVGAVITAVVVYFVARIQVRANRYKTYLEMFRLAEQSNIVDEKHRRWARSLLDVVYLDSISQNVLGVAAAVGISFVTIGYNVYVVFLKRSSAAEIETATRLMETGITITLAIQAIDYWRDRPQKLMRLLLAERLEETLLSAEIVRGTPASSRRKPNRDQMSRRWNRRFRGR